MNLEDLFGLKPFTRAQALEAGLTVRQWREVQPKLVKLRRGVYIVRKADDPRTHHCQKVAGILLTKTGHHAIGMSAVAVLNLPDPPYFRWKEQPVQIGAARTRESRRVTKSAASTIETEWGPCADAVSTAIHIASERPLPEALMVTDAVARILAGTTDRLELASPECRDRVRRRLTRDNDLPALALANPAADSPAESFCRGHMIEYGFEDPTCGVPLIDARGKQRFVDLLLDLFAIEVDGDGKYDEYQALRMEKRREHDLTLAHRLWFHRILVDDLYRDPLGTIEVMAKEEAEVRLMRKLTG